MCLIQKIFFIVRVVSSQNKFSLSKVSHPNLILYIEHSQQTKVANVNVRRVFDIDKLFIFMFWCRFSEKVWIFWKSMGFLENGQFSSIFRFWTKNGGGYPDFTQNWVQKGSKNRFSALLSHSLDLNWSILAKTSIFMG
jgi:hypothetical protein